MAISIAASEVKSKAMIASADTTHDVAIALLISEMQPPLEYSVADCYLADSDAGLQATLKLGMLEIITGEFLEQMRREVGATEEFSVNGLSVGGSAQRGVELIQQGATRLSPYLKGSLPNMADSASASSTLADEPVFDRREEVW